MQSFHTLAVLVAWSLTASVTAFLPHAKGPILDPFSSASAAGRLRASGGLCSRQTCGLALVRMTSPPDTSDADSRKAVDAWQVVLAAARKRKESIKMDFFSFSQGKYGEITESRAAVFTARSQVDALKFVPVLSSLSENRLAAKRAELAELEKDLEDKRMDSKAKLADVEKEIKAAEEQVEAEYAKVAVPTSLNQVGFHDPKLRSDAEAMVSKAEKAYRARKPKKATKVLGEAQPILNALGVYPDSKAASTSLSGRLYDLKKCIDTGAEYRTGATTGTEYITVNQRIPEDVATQMASQWSSSGLSELNEWLDKPRKDPEFDRLLTALALFSTLGIVIFLVSAPGTGTLPVE